MRYFLGLQSSIIFPLGGSYGGRFDRFGVRKMGSNLKNSTFEMGVEPENSTAENGVEFQIVPLEMGSNRKSVEKSTTPINGGRF